MIERYIQALGGAAAIQTVSNRLEKGSADVMGKKTPIDIYTKAPDQRASIMHMEGGEHHRL